jgi:hypothetical protein
VKADLPAGIPCRLRETFLRIGSEGKLTLMVLAPIILTPPVDCEEEMKSARLLDAHRDTGALEVSTVVAPLPEPALKTADSTSRSETRRGGALLARTLPLTAAFCPHLGLLVGLIDLSRARLLSGIADMSVTGPE